MILGAGLRTTLLAGIGLMAVPARADVLQIDQGEAHWVAGGTSAPAVDVPAGAMSAELVPEEIPADLIVPDRVIAQPHLHAAAVPQAYKAKIAELAARFDVSPSLLEAVVWQESRWRADAVSPVGARGLAQLMPGTARELGVDASDSFANLEGGARYLRAQLDRFDGDVEKALAAYNAGPGRVERSGGVPRIRETQLYVAAIMGRLSDHSRE